MPSLGPHVGLPTLDLALDNQAMTGHLAPRLSTVTPAGHALQVVDHELLDYKPSQRGLIRYVLAAPAVRTTLIVFGKLYADPSQLTRVDQVLHHLWQDCFGADLQCSVPQPLGVIPDLAMLLYLPADGQFLDEVIDSVRAPYALTLAARWLATLHRYPLHVAKQFNLESELINLATWATLVEKSYPALADLAQRALHYLQAQAHHVAFDTQTPIHKDFHYRHVLVERGVKVIDFDELRLGDPNFDLAHFCANLHLLAYRRHGTPRGLHTLEQHFLNAYARDTGWSLQPQNGHRATFVYFYVYTCLKIARQLCFGFGPNPVPTGEERRQQVQMILQQAVTACQ